MDKIVGLVQARMGSTRLPGKVMMPLAGKPLVGHIFDRLNAVRGLMGVVLATTFDPRNEKLVEYARQCGVWVYRAVDEDDIAERLYGATKMISADAILKVNADCPLVDPTILGALVETYHSKDDVDYVSNKIEWSYPEGLSAEVISKRALAWCDAHLLGDEDRELVANWIRDHTDQFAQISVTGEQNLSQYGWAVDTPEDFVFVEGVFDPLYTEDPLFGMNQILAYVKSQPKVD